MTAPSKLILDYIYLHEKERAAQVYLTQPLGGGRVADYTWAQTMDQARRMATHLQSLGFAPGARIAILSKNCAHFFMTELAIWMAGYVSVPLYPTLAPDTIKQILTHSESHRLSWFLVHYVTHLSRSCNHHHNLISIAHQVVIIGLATGPWAARPRTDQPLQLDTGHLATSSPIFGNTLNEYTS